MIIKCPECKRQVSSLAGTCPQCGIKIVGNIIQCPNCKEFNLIGQNKCASCNHILETNETNAIKEEETEAKKPRKAAQGKPKKKTHGCVWFFLILALLTSIIAFAYFWFENYKKEMEYESYKQLENVTNPMFYQQFLDEYPESQYNNLVRKRMEKLEAETAEWQEVLKTKSRIQLLKFLQNHPHTFRKRECEDLIDSIDWSDALNIGTHEAVADYLQHHPNGLYAEVASGKLNELAKTRISQEEKIQIRGMIHSFFSNGLAKQDSMHISCYMPQTMTEFCGKKNATVLEISQFNKEKISEDVLGIHYLINNEMNFRRETLEDGSLGFALDFIVEETINRSDATQPSHHTYQVFVWLNNEKKIIRMNIN